MCQPFRPQIFDPRLPVAHATGIGYLGPPGLNLATLKKLARAGTPHSSLTLRVDVVSAQHVEVLAAGSVARLLMDTRLTNPQSYSQLPMVLYVGLLLTVSIVTARHN